MKVITPDGIVDDRLYPKTKEVIIRDLHGYLPTLRRKLYALCRGVDVLLSPEEVDLLRQNDIMTKDGIMMPSMQEFLQKIIAEDGNLS